MFKQIQNIMITKTPWYYETLPPPPPSLSDRLKLVILCNVAFLKNTLTFESFKINLYKQTTGTPTLIHNITPFMTHRLSGRLCPSSLRAVLSARHRFESPSVQLFYSLIEMIIDILVANRVALLTPWCSTCSSCQCCAKSNVRGSGELQNTFW